MGRLQNKIVLVTGASSGIGAATAIEFAREGSHLIICARRVEKLNDLVQKIQNECPNVRVHSVQLDVTIRQNVSDVIKSLPEDFKDIDVLVNNAGLSVGMDTIETVSDDAINAMIDTNVKGGVLHVTQAVLPGMKSRGRGHIINVSSIAGKEAYPGGGIYCASKHAVDAITRSLRMELVDTSINVSSVEPGMVETEFSVVRFRGDQLKADNVYKGMQPLTAQDIAETIIFIAGRPPHVQIGNMTIFPSAQAAVHIVSRK